MGSTLVSFGLRLTQYGFFSGDVEDHSSPIISFLGIFSLLGQSHVEQGREDEGQCGDKDGRDQLRRG